MGHKEKAVDEEEEEEENSGGFNLAEDSDEEEDMPVARRSMTGDQLNGLGRRSQIREEEEQKGFEIEEENEIAADTIEKPTSMEVEKNNI